MPNYRYKKNITADDQVFTFANLGATLDALTLPTFTTAPIVNILSVQGDAIVNLYQAPTTTEFKIIIGSVGLVPSVANPIPFWFEIISSEEVEAVTTHIQLITKAYVKENLPKWETYCTRQDGLKTAEEMLQIAIDRAEDEFLSHTSVTATTITTEQQALVLAIAKYNCWQFMHGDSGFKYKPSIVKNYDKVKERLNKNVIGSGNVKLEAKTREFSSGKWFHDIADENAT